MTPRLRKLTLVTHIATSVGLLGAVASFLGLAVAGLASHDALLVSSAYQAMDLITWVVIVPLILASLLIGIASSLGTNWGLFQYKWVTTKLVITVASTVVLLLQTQLIGQLASAAANATLSSPEFDHPRIAVILHSGGGLLVLLVPMVLSVYKPWGRTRYWRRKLDDLHPV